MNRRGFLKIAGAAPVGAAAAVVAPKVAQMGGQLINAGSLAVSEKWPANGFGGVPTPRAGIHAELQNLYGLLGAARRVQYQKRQWEDAYRTYRLSPWTKPAECRDRNCRLIWRKFGEDRKLYPSQQRYSEEKELQRMKKKWAKLPEWLRERAVEIHKNRERENWGNQIAGEGVAR